MDRSDDDTMLAELRELRPEPRPEFTAELDEWAAAGFPRRTPPDATRTPFTRLADRWRAMTLRRRLIPALGFALAVVVVATVVIASTGGKGGGPELMMTSATSSEASSGAEIESESSAVGGGRVGAEVEESGGAEESAEAGGAIEERPEEETEGGEHTGELAAPSESATFAPSIAGGGAAGVGGGENSAKSTPGHRDIERSASVVLGTKPGEVAAASKKVYEAVHAADGVVLNSSVQSGRAGTTGASFELLIPSRKLDDTLAAFSQIAEVRSRHDATADITAPTVGAAEELADSNASIEGLLKELGSVETEAERESVEARLREERRRHAAIRASLDHLHKRASMSEVSVRIVTSHGAGLSPGGSDSGGWGVGDALHDAGHILTIAAGVVLIGLAVLAPIALIALLVWLGNRFRVRRLRERTLG